MLLGGCWEAGTGMPASRRARSSQWQARETANVPSSAAQGRSGAHSETEVRGDSRRSGTRKLGCR
jgi:hypothetical protein